VPDSYAPGAVSEIDPRLDAALAVQLGRWRQTLRGGAGRVGWKLGVGDRERIGGGPVIGHLTTATRLEPGAVYRAAGGADLHADAEVALELGRDVAPDADAEAARAAVAGFGAALELVDLGGTDDAEAIVAANVFHRAFALGPSRPSLPAGGVQARLLVNGESRAEAASDAEFAELVRVVARLLGALGERLQAGDRIITGSVVQVAVRPGDAVVADFGDLGRVELVVARAIRLDHSIVAVSDWETSNRFYRDVVGAEVVPHGDGPRVAYRLGDTQLNVHGPGLDLSGNVARLPVQPGNSDVCFVWPGPIDEAVAHLERQGVAVETGPVARLGARGEATSVYFRDPDGSLLEFISYPER
jgi:2-keto-4-pentenoate hydratase/catechol 2,3-dioxygenase-like lactoylglutathione lyase family enzyme